LSVYELIYPIATHDTDVYRNGAWLIHRQNAVGGRLELALQASQLTTDISQGMADTDFSKDMQKETKKP
jgi:hypothetical protein